MIIQRQPEMDLRLSEESYQKTFDGDATANFILSPDMQLLACNQAAAFMFGFSTKVEMFEHSAAGNFPSRSDRVAIRCRVTEPSDLIDRPVRLHRKDGSSLLALGRFVRDQDDAGQPSGIHCHLINYAERRHTERRINRLTSQLLSAQNEERRKLSHDLHDSAGQTLIALGMNLGIIETKWPNMPEQAGTFLAECKELVQECVRNIRTVSYSLHPPLLEELGLGAALRWYVEGFSKRSAIFVSVEISEDLGRLSTEVETSLFRIVQESLANVHRHSGSKTAQIRVIREANQIVVSVSDQGRGMPTAEFGPSRANNGVGLASIRQQLALVNGYLRISAGPETTLTAYVPTNLGSK